MTSTRMKRPAAFLAALCMVGLTALTGCRESEENRAIKLEKGGYAGQTDAALTEEQRRDLRARGQRQKF
ncbi:hypothetical protein [Roseibium sp.]|uniref:hypothetical protein n=1 Tax=Roseibium sp. TaxID=1936156 RepID=UPI003A96BC45